MEAQPLLSLERAWEALAAALPEARVARLARSDALGGTLAAPVRATMDSPAWDASAMDGYALAGELEPGTVVEVSATVAAGASPGAELAAGTAAKIMTGAPVPRGADRIVPVEATDGGRERVRIDQPTAAGAHIRRSGEIFRRGDEILPRASRLTPAALALLASQGVEEVEIIARPRVAFLTTGDEVVAPGNEPRPGQLRNSHADFLGPSCRLLGIEAIDLGTVPDRPEELEERLSQGLSYDLLLVTGGVSKGDFDFVPRTLESLGCSTLFHGVAVRPGKPLLAVRHDGGLAMGLPGNPGSVIVAFTLFVQPLIHRWMGAEASPWGEALRCELATPLAANPRPFDRFVPARLIAEGGRHLTPLLSVKGSHDLAAFAGANALLRRRPGEGARAAGTECEALPLPGA